jgi:hypothetical protein
MRLPKTIAQFRIMPLVYNQIYLCLFLQKMISLQGYNSSVEINLETVMEIPVTVMRILKIAVPILMGTLSFCHFHDCWNYKKPDLNLFHLTNYIEWRQKPIVSTNLI